MRAAFAFGEWRKHGVVGVLCVGILALFRLGGEQHAPARRGDDLAGCLKFVFSRLSEYRGGFKLAVGVEYAYEAHRYGVVQLAFVAFKTSRHLPRRYNGVVVGNFGVVEYFFCFGYRGRQYRLGELRVRGHLAQCRSYLGVHIVGEICGVDTRICGKLFFVQALDKLEGLIGGPTETAVAFHL